MKKEKTKLTNENYFTPENKYLTNSKIGDYLKSPNYFYRKNILHEIVIKPSKAMVTGSAVDYLLAQDDDKPVFKVVARRNLKNPPTDCIEVNESDYEEIMAIATAVQETEVFADIDKNYIKNIILSHDTKIGKYFVGLAGRPDYILVTDKEIIIVDLKTSRTTDQRKYYYHCKDFGYFRQQSFYQGLAKKTYGDLPVRSYHLVVDKQKGIYNVVLFELDQNEINKETIKLEAIITEIANRTDYSRPKIAWEDAISLKDPHDLDELEELRLLTNDEEII